MSNITKESMIRDLTINGDSMSGLGFENPRQQQGDFVMIPRSEDSTKNFNVAMLRDQNIISTSLLINISKEVSDLNSKNYKYLQPFMSKADRKDGTEFKYYIQVILKSLEEKDLRIKELIKSEKQLETMVLDYQKVFRNYEDLRKNQTDFYRNMSNKMNSDLSNCIEFYKGYANEQIGDANFAADNFEKKYYDVSETIKNNVETIFSDIVLYSNEFTETFNDIDIEDFEPIDNEIKELNALKERLNDFKGINLEATNNSLDNQEEKLDNFHKIFEKKIEIMSRMWKSSKSLISLGVMKITQKLRSLEFESQKQKNTYENTISENEKKFQIENDANKEIIEDLEKQVEDQEFDLKQEKEDETVFLLDQIEDLKNSLEDCYKTIDGLEEIVQFKDEDIDKILTSKDEDIYDLKQTIETHYYASNRKAKEFEDLSRRYKLMLEENRDLIAKYEDVVLSMNSASRQNTHSNFTTNQNYEELQLELLMIRNQLKDRCEELKQYKNHNKKLTDELDFKNESFLLSSCKKNVLATIRESKNENVTTSVPYNREEQS